MPNNKKSESGNFLTRFHERQVAKTLVLYVAIGWGFYEIASEVLERFGFSDTVIKLLLVFIMLGFPAALFLAWYFDVDRRGVHQESDMSRADWIVVTASLLLPVVGVIIAKPYVSQSGAVVDAESTAVAVLPFSNLTGDATLEYLADGVAEEIIAGLTSLQALDVSAMNQSFRYRGNDVDSQAAGADLNVAWVVRGSVRRSGSLLRFFASIVEASSGKSVWSDTAEVSELNVFQGQDQLSVAVARALAAQTGIELQPVAASRAPDPEAYDLYLRGRHIWHRRGTVDIDQGVNMLAEATRVDPEFAKGWGALASAYATWPSYSKDGQATWRSAETVALKAIELDPRLPEPYAVLGTFAQQRQDWIGAHQFYTESLRLDSKNATAHYWYGEHLSATARYGDSVRHMRKALDLNPTYAAPKTDLAFSYLTLGAFDLGAATFRSTWDDGFRSPQAWTGNFIALIVRDQFDDSRQWVADSPLGAVSKGLLLRFVSAQAGGDDGSLVDDIVNAPGSVLDHRLKIWMLGRVGDYDAAIDYIEYRLDNGYMLDPRALWGIGIGLYEHERFPVLMERLNLVDYWNATDWGDACRPEGEAIICDGYSLTPAALNEVLAENH